MKKIGNAKGFTLVELVVVMVILGILALMIVPRITGYNKAAEESACLSSQRTIASSASAYSITAEGKAADLTKDFIQALSAYGLIADSPACPTNSDPYTVTITGGKVTVTCKEHGKTVDGEFTADNKKDIAS